MVFRSKAEQNAKIAEILRSRENIHSLEAFQKFLSDFREAMQIPDEIIDTVIVNNDGGLFEFTAKDNIVKVKPVAMRNLSPYAIYDLFIGLDALKMNAADIAELLLSDETLGITKSFDTISIYSVDENHGDVEFEEHDNEPREYWCLRELWDSGDSYELLDEFKSIACDGIPVRIDFKQGHFVNSNKIRIDSSDLSILSIEAKENIPALDELVAGKKAYSVFAYLEKHMCFFNARYIYHVGVQDVLDSFNSLCNTINSIVGGKTRNLIAASEEICNEACQNIRFSEEEGKVLVKVGGQGTMWRDLLKKAFQSNVNPETIFVNVTEEQIFSPTSDSFEQLFKLDFDIEGEITKESNKYLSSLGKSNVSLVPSVVRDVNKILRKNPVIFLMSDVEFCTYSLTYVKNILSSLSEASDELGAYLADNGENEDEGDEEAETDAGEELVTETK